MTANQTEKSSGRRKRGRRRTYFVNRAFQWRYTLLVMVAVFVVSTFMSYALFGVLYQQARANVLHPETVNVWQNAVVLTVSGLAFSLALALAFGLWTILITHRICGPMYVIEGYLNELTKGSLPEPRALRKKDEFKGLYDAFGRAVGALTASKRSDLEQLTEALRTARSGAGGSDQERRQAIELLRAQLAAMCRDTARSLGEEFPDFSPSAPIGAGLGKEQKKEFAKAAS